MESLSTKKERIERQLFHIAEEQRIEDQIFSETMVDGNIDWEQHRKWCTFYRRRRHNEGIAKRAIVGFLKVAYKTNDVTKIIGGTCFWAYTEAFTKAKSMID